MLGCHALPQKLNVGLFDRLVRSPLHIGSFTLCTSPLSFKVEHLRLVFNELFVERVPCYCPLPEISLHLHPALFLLPMNLPFGNFSLGGQPRIEALPVVFRSPDLPLMSVEGFLASPLVVVSLLLVH